MQEKHNQRPSNAAEALIRSPMIVLQVEERVIETLVDRRKQAVIIPHPKLYGLTESSAAG